MEKMIIYQNKNDITGHLVFHTPSKEALGQKGIGKIVSEIVPSGVKHLVADCTWDPDYTDALRFSGNQLEIDLEAARVVHRKKLKKLRAKKWKSMGVFPNMNPALDSLFSEKDQKTLQKLRTLDEENSNSYDLSKHKSLAELKGDVPEFLK